MFLLGSEAGTNVRVRKAIPGFAAAKYFSQ